MSSAVIGSPLWKVGPSLTVTTRASSPMNSHSATPARDRVAERIEREHGGVVVVVGGGLSAPRQRAALVQDLRERAVGADRGRVEVDLGVSDLLRLLLLRFVGLGLLRLSVGLLLLLLRLLRLGRVLLLLLILPGGLILLLLVIGLRRALLLLIVVVVVIAAADQRQAGRADPPPAPTRATGCVG